RFSMSRGGVVDDQPLQDCARFRMLDVQRQALLRAIGPDEMRGKTAHPFVVGAREIANARTFYLDDPRPEIGELSRRERPGDRVLERDDGDAGEWVHGRASRRRPPWLTSPGRRDDPSPTGARSCRRSPACRRRKRDEYRTAGSTPGTRSARPKLRADVRAADRSAELRAAGRARPGQGSLLLR